MYGNQGTWLRKVETESLGTLTRERFNVILVVFFLHYLVDGLMQAIWNW